MRLSRTTGLCLALLLVIPGLERGIRSETNRAKLLDRIASRTLELESQILKWRRDIHQHPELSNREFRTAGIVAEHLRALGLERVETEVAHTGVVGLLKGGHPGPLVALRADMDALPVTEAVDLPFASKQRTTYNGQEVGVMHACGHDVHTSVLMGVAQILAEMREDLPGQVLFLFQPAEEGPPRGEEGGAKLMLEEGVFETPPSAIFGLHARRFPSGVIAYRPKAAMASSDSLLITVRGRQTHGALPWNGVDPIVISSQIVLGLQTITSRQLDSRTATIISIGSVHGGNRGNIIPDEVAMEGTIRILDPERREDVMSRIRRTVEQIAGSAGATATVEIISNAPITYNDPDLVQATLPVLKEAAGEKNVVEVLPWMPAEDFAYFQERVPGFYFFLGIDAPGTAPESTAPNHSPRFRVHEEALEVGVRVLASVATDFLIRNASPE